MTYQHDSSSTAAGVSDEELLAVIADFLNMGHVDNILAMVRQEPRYLAWTGQLLEDERFAVRVGVLVLLEHLVETHPHHLDLAIDGLIEQLAHPVEWVRGDAASALGIIGAQRGLAALSPLRNDPSPQVVEIVSDILSAAEHG